jgi:EAL domain-containing protein (putative c-di-GMP-specific phosphodiesterase class I)
MAVNVSPTQFKWHSRLDEEVLDTLRKTRISADLLELELTETALMQASRDNSSLLQAMRDRGIRIAIDDFGTGYSCLDYLRRFPASRIKIAQTFVAEITHSAGSAAITRATISLGRELGLSVIAEGVETAEQVDLLTKWGCHEAQGYRYAKPMPSEKIPELLRQGKIQDPDALPESSRCARSA